MTGFSLADYTGLGVGLVGIVLAMVTYLRTRLLRRLVAVRTGFELVGTRATADDIVIHYAGLEVPRVSKTSVTIWNAGTTTFDGRDVIASDPLRIEIPHDQTILRASLVEATRTAIGPTLRIQGSTVLISFDFLDPQDGFTVDLLHTAHWHDADVVGTVKGLPDGIAMVGSQQNVRSERRGTPRLPRWVTALLAFAPLMLLVTGEVLVEVVGTGHVRWPVFAAIAGLLAKGDLLAQWISGRRYKRRPMIPLE